VLLHGLGGTWHIWKPVINVLAMRHRVVALTLPGHCGGPALASGVEPTVSAIADTLLQTLAARGIVNGHVVGNSLGGWLALELARRGFARSVTVFSPAGAWRRPEDYRAISGSFRIIFALMPLLLALVSLFLGFGALRRLLGRKTMEHAERIEAREFRDSLRAFAHTLVMRGLLHTMGRDGPIAALSAPTTPMRIVWCEQDRVIPFERYGRPMLERIDGAEFRLLPGAGHVPMYDQPAAVAASILEVTGAADARIAAA
jgi:pimeloyl-ACP methyl ester carboxylesterase